MFSSFEKREPARRRRWVSTRGSGFGELGNSIFFVIKLIGKRSSLTTSWTLWFPLEWNFINVQVTPALIASIRKVSRFSSPVFFEIYKDFYFHSFIYITSNSILQFISSKCKFLLPPHIDANYSCMHTFFAVTGSNISRSKTIFYLFSAVLQTQVFCRARYK